MCTCVTYEFICLSTRKYTFKRDFLFLSKISNTGSDAKTAEITKYAETFNALVKENKQKEAYAYLYDQ